MQNNNLHEHVTDLVKQASELLTRASLALNNGLVVGPDQGLEVEPDGPEVSRPEPDRYEGDKIWRVLSQMITLPHGCALDLSYEPANNSYILAISKAGTDITYCRLLDIFSHPLPDDFGYKLNLLSQVKAGLTRNLLLDFETVQENMAHLSFNFLVFCRLDADIVSLRLPIFISKTMLDDIRTHQVFLIDYTEKFTDNVAREAFLQIAAEQHRELSYQAMWTLVNWLYDCLVCEVCSEFFEHCRLDFYDFRPQINLQTENNGEATIKPAFEIIFDGVNALNLTMEVLTDENKKLKFVEKFYEYMSDSLHSRIITEGGE